MIFLALLNLFSKLHKCSDESDIDEEKSQKRLENPQYSISERKRSDQDINEGNVQTQMKISDLTSKSQQQKPLDLSIQAMQRQQEFVNRPKNENNESLVLSASHKTEMGPLITFEPHLSDEQKTNSLYLRAESKPVWCTEISLTTSKLFECSIEPLIEGEKECESPSTSKTFESRTTKRHTTCTNEQLISEKKQKISERAREEPESTVNTKILREDLSKTVSIIGCRKRKQTKPKKLSKTKSENFVSVEKKKECVIENLTKSRDEEVKTGRKSEFIEKKGTSIRTPFDIFALQYIFEQFSELKKLSKLTEESFKNQFIAFVERFNLLKKIRFAPARRCDIYFDLNVNTNLILGIEWKKQVLLDDIDQQVLKNEKICILGKRIVTRGANFIDCVFFIPKVVESYQQFNQFDESESIIITSENEEYCLVLFTLRFSAIVYGGEENSGSADARSVDEQIRTCSLALIYESVTCPLKKYVLVFHNGQAALLKRFKTKLKESSYTIHILTEENAQLLRDQD